MQFCHAQGRCKDRKRELHVGINVARWLVWPVTSISCVDVPLVDDIHQNCSAWQSKQKMFPTKNHIYFIHHHLVTKKTQLAPKSFYPQEALRHTEPCEWFRQIIRTRESDYALVKSKWRRDVSEKREDRLIRWQRYWIQTYNSDSIEKLLVIE